MCHGSRERKIFYGLKITTEVKGECMSGPRLHFNMKLLLQHVNKRTPLVFVTFNVNNNNKRTLSPSVQFPQYSLKLPQS